MTSIRRLVSAICSVVCAIAPAASRAQAPAPGAPVEAATARASSPRPAATAEATGAGHAAGAEPGGNAASPAGPPPAPAASPLNPTRDEFPAPAAGVANAELDALMARVTALRARIAALGAGLFSSKLRVELRSQSDGARLKTLRVSLDGGIVYSAPAHTAFDRPELVYEHAVAAGPHVIAVDVERQDLREPRFTTWQSSRFVVVVPEKRLLWTRLELEDESSLGEEFAEDEAGQYELGVRLQVEASE